MKVIYTYLTDHNKIFDLGIDYLIKHNLNRVLIYCYSL